MNERCKSNSIICLFLHPVSCATSSPLCYTESRPTGKRRHIHKIIIVNKYDYCVHASLVCLGYFAVVWPQQIDAYRSKRRIECAKILESKEFKGVYIFFMQNRLTRLERKNELVEWKRMENKVSKHKWLLLFDSRGGFFSFCFLLTAIGTLSLCHTRDYYFDFIVFIAHAIFWFVFLGFLKHSSLLPRATAFIGFAYSNRVVILIVLVC